jgi:hypothetical protein
MWLKGPRFEHLSRKCCFIYLWFKCPQIKEISRRGAPPIVTSPHSKDTRIIIQFLRLNSSISVTVEVMSLNVVVKPEILKGKLFENQRL